MDQRSASLHAHPILIFLKITRNDNRRNWTPLSPITITYHEFDKQKIECIPHHWRCILFMVLENNLR